MHLKKPFIMMQACGALFFSSLAFAEATSETITAEEYSENWEEKITNPESPTEESVTLPTFEIEGRALSLYKEDEATFATRTTTPIDETPQSLQVLTSELIEDQAATEATDLYRSMSGVSFFNYSAVTVRGFEQDGIVLFDGIKGNPFGLFTIQQLFNIDEVQILKGPSGAVYGAGEAGGVINYVTKKPTYEQENSVEFTIGNKDFLSGSVESSGAANEDGSQRYRVGLYSSGGDSYRNNVEEENLVIDLGYAWDLNDDSTLTLQYTHSDQKDQRLRGVPIDTDGNFLTDTSWNSNEPDDAQEFRTDIFQASLETSINNWLDNKSSLRYFESKETITYHQTQTVTYSDDGDDSNDEVSRRYFDQTRIYKGLDLSSYFVASLDNHTIVTGADYHFASEDELFYRIDSGIDSLSLTNPVYDADISSYDLASNLNRDRVTELNQVGAYIQDQWQATEKFSVLAGIRLDYVEEDVDNQDGSADAKYDDTGYSTRLGATYALSHQFKPYASFSTSLTPQEAADQKSKDGSLFDPEENQQFEIGVRSYLLNNRVNVNLALYHIVKNNILAEDPDDDDYNVSIGEIRSQGFEVDVLADITSRWVANINYAYNDLEVKDTDADTRALSNSPYHQLGLWTRYEFPSITSSIAFGADYVSEQSDRDENIIQPFTVYDLSWQTLWQDWKFQANIKNLFDKEYAISGFNSKYANIGERRRIYLKASYDF
ncbi:TonB-dependent receptor [Marinomonas sp. C2222]|uniref:TonB-dependent receptor n=1 Tax=Marinomonas sargassi TaxID=2984494 RepID=A0ABT2YTP9_9GAMM|nr:TonB-dependent receptor [Marinomonas sargassi]MCV2403241.1 TonB-dependent receptor [Marinomonas sargassi]